jgi:hypothetical protein
MATSPSVYNYKTGGANVYFAEWSGSTPPTLPGDYKHVGNCPHFSTDPKFQKLVHKSSMGAMFEEDESRIIERSLSIKLTLDEIDVDNLAMFFGGVKGDEYTVLLLEDTTKVFAVKLVSVDDIGPQWTIELWKVELSGGSAMQWINMNEYAKIELEGKVLSDAAYHPSNRFGKATLPSA